jgi:predicted DNA-binding transcriptional regulator YafY
MAAAEGGGSVPRNVQLVRTLKLLRILADSRRGIPLKTLADHYGWTLRTIYRDIDALEESGFPVIHEDGRYRLPPGSLRVPDEQLQPEERLALFAMRQLAGGLRETTAGRALDRLWQRLSGERPGRPLLLPADQDRTVGLRSPLAVDYGAHRRTIATIEEALATSRALSCRYEALSTGELTARVVEPGDLHWDPALESLYLIAWCRLREAIRVFAVHRFRMMSLLPEQVRPRPECRSRHALRNAFRVWRDDHVRRAVVRLSGWAAREARERTLHPSQQLERAQGGDVRLTLDVAGLEEVARWVMSYGSLAVVEEPPELAELVGRELRQAAARYRSGMPVDAEIAPVVRRR